MQGEVAGIKLPVRPSNITDITKSNKMLRYVLQFHDCPSCYQINRERKLTSGTSGEDTIDARYERNLARTWRLRQRGYRVMEKWECKFAREKRENREMHNFLENHPMLINPTLDLR